FSWLIEQYRQSSWFTDLADSTQREYGYVLDGLKTYLREKKAEEFDAAEFTRKHARIMYERIAGGKPEEYVEGKPGKAEKFVTLARIVYNYGIEIEAVTENPFKALRIRKGKPRRQLWLDLD